MESRSRSPLAKFSKHELPKLKTWVLVMAGKRRWSNAVPALVSKVTNCKTLDSKAETRVTVLVPNLLTLQCNFNGSPYRELQDLKLQEVKPYHGNDHTQLKDALLEGIRKTALERSARDEQRQDQRKELNAPLKVGAPNLQVSHRKSIANFFKVGAGSVSSHQETQVQRHPAALPEEGLTGHELSCPVVELGSEELHTTKQNIERFFKVREHYSSQHHEKHVGLDLQHAPFEASQPTASLPATCQASHSVTEERHTTKVNIAKLFRVGVGPTSPITCAGAPDPKEGDHMENESVDVVTPPAVMATAPHPSWVASATATAVEASALEMRVQECSRHHQSCPPPEMLQTASELAHADAASSSPMPQPDMPDFKDDELGKKDDVAVACSMSKDPSTPPAQRKLTRAETPLNPELPETSVKATSCTMTAAKIGLVERRLADITAVISRKFASAQEGMLTKQEIAEAADYSSLGLLEGELDEVLKQLDADNKVLLSNDLVFIV